jgi:hypothetical protein
MTKHHPNVLPKTREILHSASDEDFDQWLDTIPATDTASLIPKYYAYAAQCVEKNVDLLTFSEWREQYPIGG